MRRPTWFVAGIVGLGLLLAAAYAVAIGYKTQMYAQFPDSNTAEGAFGSVRANIGSPADGGVGANMSCQVDTYPDSSLNLVRCWITDQNNVTKVCTSTQQWAVDAVKLMNAESRLLFTVAADGSCTHIQVENGSMYPAKSTGPGPS